MQYRLSLSHKGKFVYYHNAKCGSRSIIHFLKQQTELSQEGTCDNHQPIFYKQDWNDYFQFSFVRNPYGRLLSLFLDKTKKVIGTKWELERYAIYKNVNFEDFVMNLSMHPWQEHDSHLKLQSDVINLKNTVFIGRLENMKPHFTYVAEILGLKKRLENKPWILPHFNTTDHSSYREYYNNEMIHKVYSIYKKDFERFKYTF